MNIKFLTLFVFLTLLFGVKAQNRARFEVKIEKIAFQSGGETLRGDLRLPIKPGPHPAFVTVHGSGYTTRNGHFVKTFAERFSRLGFAVLTYDKRGTGESEGELPKSNKFGMRIFADDAIAAIKFLKERPDIDSTQIGLEGVSQAGWISPMAAVESGDIAFNIIVSGPTTTIFEEDYYSDLTGDNQAVPTNLPAEEIEKRVREKGPRGFGALPWLKRMNIPTLWIYGELDQSIPVFLCLEMLDNLIENDGKPFEYKIFENANHGLKVAKTGGRWERPVPRKTVPGYFETMEEWLFQRISFKEQK